MMAKAGSGTDGAGRGGPGRAVRAAGASRRGLRAAALTLAATTGAQLGCTQKTMISVTVATPAGSADPFTNAAMARLTIGSNQNAAAVTAGKFEVNVDIDAPAQDQLLQVVVEALDSSGVVVGRGATPMFDSNNREVTVFVNRQGQVGSSELRLPDDSLNPGSALGRRDLMGATLIGRQVSPAEPSFGALLVGGAGDDTSLASKALIYKSLTHQIIDAGSPSAAGPPSVSRRGGVLIATADATTGQQAVLWGGSTAGGALPTTADKFDPGVSTLAMVWAHPEAPYDEAGGPGAYGPSAAAMGTLGSTYLVCGGSGVAPGMTAGDPQLAQAVLLKRNPPPSGSTDQTARIGVTRIPAAMDGTGPMMAPRYQHTVTATGDGSAAVIFGGLSAADANAGTKPAAELFTMATGAFTPFAFMPAASTPPSRRGHVATRLRNGQILIAGGYTYEPAGTKTVVGSALIIDPAAHTVQTLPQTSFLKTPRYAATITSAGGELVICGGFDANDKAIADCEIFSSDTANPTRGPIPMSSGRAGHLALTLDNGLTLLVGGVDQNNNGLSSIDIYTSMTAN